MKQCERCLDFILRSAVFALLNYAGAKTATRLLLISVCLKESRRPYSLPHSPGQLSSNWLPLSNRRFKQQVGGASVSDMTILGISHIYSVTKCKTYSRASSELIVLSVDVQMDLFVQHEGAKLASASLH